MSTSSYNNVKENIRALLLPSIWQLAWPITITNLLLAQVGFIQIILSTNLGTEATAAITVSQRVFFSLKKQFSALLTNDIKVQHYTAQFLLIIAFSTPLIAAVTNHPFYFNRR